MSERVWDAVKGGVLDFISREAGQRRRAALDSALNETVDGLLGPTGIPDRLRALGILNPVNDMEQAYTKAGTVFSPDATGRERFDAGVGMVTDMATVLAPVAGGRMAGATSDGAANLVDSLLGIGAMPREETANALRRFAVDEYGGTGTNKGIRAYHGSPHDFDKFSMDKIGTGEGAQAYGHGLYFAENEAVARGYRDQLSRPFYAVSDGSHLAAKYGDDVQDIFERSGGDPDDLRETVARLRRQVDRALKEAGVSSLDDLPPSTFQGDFTSTVADAANRADRLDRLIKSDTVEQVNPGSMYEVRINANPDDFLDWDKPLSEQPQAVLDRLKRLRDPIRGDVSIGDMVETIEAAKADPKLKYILDDKTLNPTGDQVSRMVRSGYDRTGTTANTDALAAQELNYDAGIPGIKYLDAGSRGAGDGSRNYVVFDENLIEIVRKYGIAGAAAMLGVSVQNVEAAVGREQPKGLLQ